VKKNLFYFDKNNSSNANGSLVGQKTCEPCASECEKIKNKINNRKLSDIKNEEAAHILFPFNAES
jgi:hypothetical protein